MEDHVFDFVVVVGQIDNPCQVVICEDNFLGLGQLVSDFLIERGVSHRNFVD